MNKLNCHIHSKIFFFDTLKDLASAKAYVVLTVPETTLLTDKFEALGKLKSANLEIGSNFDSVNSDLDAGIAWCSAIYIAIQDDYFPYVVLPLRKYEAAMSALHLGDQRDY